MQEEHRKAIQNNFKSLVEQTDLDTMVTNLYEKGVFSSQMIEKYKDTNKDVRNRKRLLYSDIMRRGPEAFQHLLDALMENGYWDLLRDLDPKSLPPHSRRRTPLPATSKSSGDNNFVSIRKEREKKAKSAPDVNKNVGIIPPAPPENKEPLDPAKIPHFRVNKSEKFMEEMGDGFTLYRTRGRQRGVLVIFSYVDFNDMEPYRKGVDVDCMKLKYLFIEFGFTVLAYKDLTKDETLKTLSSLKEVVGGSECLFIVVSSHGHARSNTSDNDFRCHDGSLIGTSEMVELFNNKNFPVLKGIPKVFIFQMCRGQDEGYQMLSATASDGAPYVAAPASSSAPAAPAPASPSAPAAPAPAAPAPSRVLRPPGPLLERNYSDILIAHSTIPGMADLIVRNAPASPSAPAAPAPAAPAPARVPRPPGPLLERNYSDILIAHSTIPGNVSYRDEIEGSWYIQALCEVFAEFAHRCHVEELFTLVDRKLHAAHRRQTSSVDRWGFNSRLYLHPGLFETLNAPLDQAI